MSVITHTSFGLVTRWSGKTTVSATPEELRAWASNPYGSWPCSVLARCEGGIVAEFDEAGDLVGLEGDEGQGVVIRRVECMVVVGVSHSRGLPVSPCYSGGMSNV